MEDTQRRRHRWGGCQRKKRRCSQRPPSSHPKFEFSTLCVTRITRSATYCKWGMHQVPSRQTQSGEMTDRLCRDTLHPSFHSVHNSYNIGSAVILLWDGWRVFSLNDSRHWSEQKTRSLERTGFSTVISQLIQYHIRFWFASWLTSLFEAPELVSFISHALLLWLVSRVFQ